MNKGKYIKLYKLTLFVLYISSLRPWFMEYISSTIIFIFGAVVSLLFYSANKKLFQVNKTNKNIIILLSLFFLWNSLRDSIIPAIGYFIEMIPLSFLIFTRPEVKESIFKYITKGMAIICFITIPFYVLYWFDVPLNYTIIKLNELSYINNYYFFITEHNPVFSVRFSSIFLEPGFLTFGIIPLLYINKLNIKNISVFVLLISQILSFSLAGFILLFLILIVFSFDKTDKRIRNWSRVSLFSAIVAISVFVGTIKEDSYFYLTLASRLAYNETSGTIKGNNRTSDDMKYLYDKTKNTPQIIIGHGRDNILSFYERYNMKGGNAGFVIYLMTYGMIGVFFAFLFFFIYYRMFKCYETLGLFAIFIIMLYQNSYWNWCSILFAYILGMDLLYRTHLKFKN